MEIDNAEQMMLMVRNFKYIAVFLIVIVHQHFFASKNE